jgi:acetylornithine/succinyldiaminopimelate/putrescine aminotransferase
MHILPYGHIGSAATESTQGGGVPVITQAITEQATTLLQTSNQFYTTPQLLLAQLLVEHSCLDRVFFGNSGAEANEGAIKLARKYGKEKRHGAYEIITADHSFHGRTMTTLAATGQPHYQEPFIPLPPGFVHVAYNDVEAIKHATTQKTVAVMLEPVQGEGGVNIPAADYLQQVRAWCDQQGLLLILDEVQTGMGRLGSLFGYQEYGVEPDVLTLAKGLGCGVPIGAFLSPKSSVWPWALATMALPLGETP